MHVLRRITPQARSKSARSWAGAEALAGVKGQGRAVYGWGSALGAWESSINVRMHARVQLDMYPCFVAFMAPDYSLGAVKRCCRRYVWGKPTPSKLR